MTIPNTGRQSKGDAITWRLHLQGHVADGEPVVATWQFPGCQVLSQVAYSERSGLLSIFAFFFSFISFEIASLHAGGRYVAQKNWRACRKHSVFNPQDTVGSSRWDPPCGRRVRPPRRRRTGCIARSLEVSGVSAKGGGFPTWFHEAYLSTSRAVSVMMTLMANANFWHPLFSLWIRPHIYLLILRSEINYLPGRGKETSLSHARPACVDTQS